MRNSILLVTILLSLFITQILTQRGDFEFHDSRGRCWHCTSRYECVRCLALPYDWDWHLNWTRICDPPDLAQCLSTPTLLFPSARDPNKFYRCDSEPFLRGVPYDCPCDTVFDAFMQACVSPSDHTHIFRCYWHEILPDNPNPCQDVWVTFPVTEPIEIPTKTFTEETTTTTTLNFPTVPTALPTTDTTTIIITTTPPPPIIPTTPDTTTYATTTINIKMPTVTEISINAEVPTITTSKDGNESGNNVTPPACFCILWWPCRCNPFWLMG